MSADRMPITATPPKVPADCRLLMLAMRVCTAAGICSVNSPNIDSASAMNSAANNTRIQVCWNTACTCLPAAAHTAPAIV